LSPYTPQPAVQEPTASLVYNGYNKWDNLEKSSIPSSIIDSQARDDGMCQSSPYTTSLTLLDSCTDIISPEGFSIATPVEREVCQPLTNSLDPWKLNIGFDNATPIDLESMENGTYYWNRPLDESSTSQVSFEEFIDFQDHVTEASQLVPNTLSNLSEHRRHDNISETSFSSSEADSWESDLIEDPGACFESSHVGSLGNRNQTHGRRPIATIRRFHCRLCRSMYPNQFQLKLVSQMTLSNRELRYYTSQHIATHCRIQCDLPGCRAEFSHRKELERHKRTSRVHRQGDSAAYHCSSCGKDFSRRDNYRRHFKRSDACRTQSMSELGAPVEADGLSDNGNSMSLSADNFSS
jgi:hypothetical protein